MENFLRTFDFVLENLDFIKIQNSSTYIPEQRRGIKNLLNEWLVSINITFKQREGEVVDYYPRVYYLNIIITSLFSSGVSDYLKENILVENLIIYVLHRIHKTFTHFHLEYRVYLTSS